MFIAHEETSYKEAVDDTDKEKWQEAMVYEIQELPEYQTWRRILPPSKLKLIICRWAFMVKHATKETEKKFRARLVPKGFQEKLGIHFNGTFAPVAKLSSIHLQLAHAHTKGMIVRQFDIKNIFLNGQLFE